MDIMMLFDCSVSSFSSCLIPSLYHIFSCFFFVLPLVARIYPCLSFRGLKTGTSNAWTMNIVSQHFGRRTYGKNMRKYSHYICSSYHHHYIQNQKTISPPYPHDIGLGIPIYTYINIYYTYILYTSMCIYICVYIINIIPLICPYYLHIHHEHLRTGLQESLNPDRVGRLGSCFWGIFRGYRLVNVWKITICKG